LDKNADVSVRRDAKPDQNKGDRQNQQDPGWHNR
jgi:hypothetical protein